ncbi:MAG: LolA family protein [bacterium]
MKRYLIPLSLLILVLLIVFSTFANERSPVEILSDAWDAEGKISFVATETSGMYIRGRLNVTVSKVFALATGKFRREYLFPSFLAGDLLIDDGHSSYYYQPNKGLVTIGPSLYDLPYRDIHSKLLELILKNYDVSSQPDKFLGRDVTKVYISPKNSKNVLLVFWIDNQTNLILKRERYSSDGKLQEYSFYTDIDFSTVTNERLFVWVKPGRDFRILERRERFIPLEKSKRKDVILVKLSPLQEKGYECISIKEVPGGIAYHFSDGINNIMFFDLQDLPSMPPSVRKVTTDGIRYSYWQFDGMSGFAWSYDRKNFLIIGVVERDIIEKIIKGFKY